MTQSYLIFQSSDTHIQVYITYCYLPGMYAYAPAIMNSAMLYNESVILLDDVVLSANKQRILQCIPSLLIVDCTFKSNVHSYY